MASKSRRNFNNFLIFAILCFIMLFNLPTALKARFSLNEERTPSADNFPNIISLLPENLSAEFISFSSYELRKQGKNWQSNISLNISANELATRWLSLSGTAVDEELFTKIQPNLTKAFNLKIKGADKDEAYHVTYYQLPNFWLMQNWQNQWLAVSVEPKYLLPLN